MIAASMIRIATAVAQTGLPWAGPPDQAMMVNLILSASEIHRRMIMRSGLRRIGCLPARR